MPGPRHIALFGSSFNPPHNGHLAVLKDLTRKKIFDEIWLLPVYRHPFAKNLWPYHLRLKLVRLLLKDLPKGKIKISQIEKTIGKNPSYMVDTVSVLRKKFPSHEFTLILGSNCKRDLKHWHRFAKLEKLVNFYFIPRRGYAKSPYPKVSSTEIRERLKTRKSLRGLVPALIEKNLRAMPLGILSTLCF